MNQKMKTAPAAENKMGTMPIGKLLFNMSLPMMISMLVQALYNIVDSIFVAKLSENALTAVSLAFPLQTLLIAVATGTGVGMNALLSKVLGERRSDEADKIAVNAAFIYFLSYLVFLILGFTIVKPFYASQIGTADAEIMEMGIDYLRTVMIFSFGLLSQIFFERLLTSTGRTIFSMTSIMWSDYEYYFRSDHDLWITRMSQNGRYRCCCRNRHRTVCRCNRRIHLQSQVQPRCKTAFSWFPPQCKDHWNHLCDWCTFDYHAVHRFCHDLLHEPDSDRVFFNRNSRFWCVL